MQQLNVKKINNEEIKVLEVLIEKAHADVQFRKKCLENPIEAIRKINKQTSLLNKAIKFVPPNALVFMLPEPSKSQSLPSEKAELAAVLREHLSHENIQVIETVRQKACNDSSFRKKCLTDPRGSLEAIANRPYLLDKEICFIEPGTLVFTLSDRLQKTELENAAGGGFNTVYTGIIAITVVTTVVVVKQQSPE